MQQTPILAVDHPSAVQRAASALAAGELIVIPTDTVYGVAADPLNAEAIDRLFHAKERLLSKGIPLLLANAATLARYAAAEPSDTVRRLIERWWPGPLTVVVTRRDNLPANLSPNDKIALRVPDLDASRAVIAAAGGALAVTSANRSGEPPAQSAAEAAAALGDHIALVLDGGPSPGSVASTVLDCTADPPHVLRPGPISAEQVAALTSSHNATP